MGTCQESNCLNVKIDVYNEKKRFLHKKLCSLGFGIRKCCTGIKTRVWDFTMQVRCSLQCVYRVYDLVP